MKITIDGKHIETEENKTILEVARENDIFIPSLCDHPRLAPFTGCRLCIVEIEGRKNFPPSCGTYVEEGMKIKTNTARLRKWRKQILELILSEHPNACLICSEKENCDEYKSTIRKVGEVTGCVLCANNGRCELQDVVESLGLDKVSYPSLYRHLDVKKQDPFLDRDYNLCILCGRCVRVCQDVRGASAISFVYRGTRAVVSTVLDRPLIEAGCQFCGACVDVCPTGALFERGIRYEILPDAEVRTICAFCSMGCTLSMNLCQERILSSKPVMEGAVNRGQACLRGRFTVRDVVYSSRRITKPIVRKKRELVETTWEEALDIAAQGLKKYKGKELALVVSSQLSCEDIYVFHKFARDALNTKNIWHGSGHSPFAAFARVAERNGLPGILDFRIRDISRAKVIFVLDEELIASHPIVWLEVLEAVRKGARLIVASGFSTFFSRYASLSLCIEPGSESRLLQLLSKFLLEISGPHSFSQVNGFTSFRNFVDKLDSSRAPEMTGVKQEDLREASRLLYGEGPAVFLFGSGLTRHPSGQENLVSLWNLALLTGAKLVPLGLESNLRGADEISRHFPSNTKGVHQIIQGIANGEVKALYLAGPMPFLGRKKPEFLVVQDSFMNDKTQKADVVFPATTFVETEGVLINTEGRLQKAEKIVHPLGEVRPDWWIVTQLAQKMGKKNFAYKKSSQILKEISGVIPGLAKASYPPLKKGREIFIQEKKKGERKFLLPGAAPTEAETSKKYPYLLMLDYSLDYYRNLPLSEEIRGMGIIRDSRWIRISPEDAGELQVKEGEEIVVESPDGRCKGLARISVSLPKGRMKASILWNDGSDHSAVGLMSFPSAQSLSLGPIPVRIKRGK